MGRRKKKEKPVINIEPLQSQLSLTALHELKPNNEIVNYLNNLAERKTLQTLDIYMAMKWI